VNWNSPKKISFFALPASPTGKPIMTFSLWSIFAASYLVTTLSPGPNVLLVLNQALKYGWRSIYVTILGNLFCQLLIIAAIALGIGALVARNPYLYEIMKMIGGTYLIYYGMRILYRLVRGENGNLPLPLDGTQVREQQTFVAGFREAFFVSASNPKTVIFLSAFLPQFVDSQRSIPLQFAIMFVTIALIVASIHTLYALSASELKRRIVNRRTNQALSVVTGALFAVLGIGIVVS
jgi:threonine/homoserine/homoserine lactone efflux protein